MILKIITYLNVFNVHVLKYPSNDTDNVIGRSHIFVISIKCHYFCIIDPNNYIKTNEETKQTSNKKKNFIHNKKFATIMHSIKIF